MRCLVMGGTQFNGLALTRELARTGHDVTIVNRGKTPVELPLGVQRRTADRSDAAAVKAAVAGDWDVFYDVTAYRPDEVAQMAELLRGRVGHYVFISSTVIYAASERVPIHEDFPLDRSPQQNEYGRWKIECEDLLVREHRERGFPATTVALSMGFGPGNILPDREQRMFARLLQGRPILIPGDGTTLAQVGHVDDQARALRMLGGNRATIGKRYNLSGADAVTADGYVDTFAAVVGVRPNKVYVPAALMDDLYAGRTWLARGQANAKVDIRSTTQTSQLVNQRFQLTMLVQRIAPHIHHWNRSVVFGIERLQGDVGWRPEFTFPTAVEHTYAWFRQQRLHETLKFDWGWEDQLLELAARSR